MCGWCPNGNEQHTSTTMYMWMCNGFALAMRKCEHKLIIDRTWWFGEKKNAPPQLINIQLIELMKADQFASVTDFTPLNNTHARRVTHNNCIYLNWRENWKKKNYWRKNGEKERRKRDTILANQKSLEIIQSRNTSDTAYALCAVPMLSHKWSFSIWHA